MAWDERIDRALVYPPLLHLGDELMARCADRGAHYLATCGFRSHEEQATLYAQGRELRQEGWRVVDRSKVVTYAPPGRSKHNYGLALDFCRDGKPEVRGLQPDWHPEAYLPLVEEAEALGLESGGRWERFRDWPHVEWRLVPSYDALELAYAQVGFEGVWKWITTINERVAKG